MSATLQARSVAAAFGDRELFSGLDLVVAPGDVVGLVGPNGAGKTTLLRILAGQRPPDAGSVALSPPTAQVGYLVQEVERRPDESVRAYLERRTGVHDAQRAMDAASDALAVDAPDAADEFTRALERWMALGGADLDTRLDVVAADLGLAVDLDLPMTALSGGQAARVGLAALLLSRFDMYLLDEPTNDLDADGLDRLEEFVERAQAPVVVVSHDREFLARTVTTVVEIDRSLQRVVTYGGSYDAYLEERSTARRQAREAYEDYAGRRDALASRARMQRAWMEKGVRNARRKASDNDKHVKHHRGETSEKQASKARQTDRMIERLETVDEPRKEWQLQMSIATAPRSGAVVATTRAAVVRRGDFVLGPVDLQLDWQDRVAVTGPNGSGKSTLLALLLGRLAPDEGSASLGPGVLVGEVDQARAAFEGDEPVGEAFARQVPEWSTADVRTLLAKFGLAGHQVGRPAASLSPGERTRAALALLQARGVNLLVLDEPTNHLDLPAIEQLEHAMESFDGTILLVTHDRRMLDTVRLTRRWHVEEGQVREVRPD
ncbi:ABC-F family ATP-binding cassette domain-containing protein [Cellulomonas dongxiuzhuiae]|uniref:ATP-binding cassette domain-containing protein n=1 Tax=Cellulomonas dongxiuzhuiae TaxID=2819979 RepID=A0ABX8GIX5_9CELL|nr:ABC-F family ATP-binding cassette domain-containing protein [Cellulomonas dongxiuzhuiae]MBO3089507.1 ABC-F family ATP-binding cassette domain-containing protein [Cellulomonas dongxiuzhuiae]MBO3095143.1 ABC-F family ATP-binding cassette domain-containing protein [Cellulomonas dongxiuzhuiae]QWC16148.1 ATP-binding cassette domain-containing protein [Cellulomonas dongxiuzhuiae]